MIIKIIYKFILIGQGGNKCTSCKLDKFLNYDFSCVDVCEEDKGFYENTLKRLCEKCDENCYTCEIEATKCLTCR